MFEDNFYTKSIYIEEQSGNYRATLRENNDAVQRLNWQPKDRLKDYINSL